MYKDLATAWNKPSDTQPVLTVSQLNAEARELLESGFPPLAVAGEISNLARPTSGHLYFSLKDAHAQVRCAMFRRANQRLGFAPENGSQVVARGRISLYEPRGEFQLVVEDLEPAGDGALRQAFEKLKQKLAAEGLFDEAVKRPIPALPRRIGVITSPTGAAIRDILTTLKRRFPGVPVLVYAVPVQGEGAAERIAAALRRAGSRRDCDVLILARGGGALEDLWSFNEEVVARAVRGCGLPVIAGVGHETDVTIADFAADWRAPTPTGAAARAVPDRQELTARVQVSVNRLHRNWSAHCRQRHQHIAWLRGRLDRAHPGRRLHQHAQRIDELDTRLRRCARVRVGKTDERLRELGARLGRQHPARLLSRYGEQLRDRQRRLKRATDTILTQRRTRVQALVRHLEAVSPLPTLHRGYAVVQRGADGRILRDAADVRPGERIAARLARGRLYCLVEETDTDTGDDTLVKPAKGEKR